MDRSRFRLYIFGCALRRLREAMAADLPGPEAVQAALRYLRALYPLEVDEWALLAVALFAAADQHAERDWPGRTRRRG